MPARLLEHVANQLSINPDAFALYGKREATVFNHFQDVLVYLKVRRWQPLLDSVVLEKWLLERALEHDSERVLLSLACDKLRQEGILRPGIIELERLIGSLAEQANQETYRRLQNLLTEELKARLDLLLEVDVKIKMTRYYWILRPPASSNSKTVNAVLEKLAFIRDFNVNSWPADAINPNRQKRLAQIARGKTNQALQRLSDAKRYLILVSFLKEMCIDLTDLVVKMFDEFWEDVVAKSRNEMQEFQSRAANQKDYTMLQTGKALAMVVDEESIPNGQLREAIYENIPKEELIKLIEDSRKLTAPTRHMHLDFLEKRYGYIKQCSVYFLEAITFQDAYKQRFRD